MKQYSDFSNVEVQREYLTVETLPEGPYGAPRGKYSIVKNKSGPWLPGQRYYSAFNYENKGLHKHIPRLDPGAHKP
ncbi:cytosolic protein [Jeotgalibacillus aurantiacus]|uniref:cytosolic protein n=1 Tax=Jeotgalibacillus aurantiacus TaxID=2763266 RepID=UPI001D0BCE72|nr:cytosolic protein [Jeotgalibacillus aurantiacus]